MCLTKIDKKDLSKGPTVPKITIDVKFLPFDRRQFCKEKVINEIMIVKSLSF